MTDVKVADEGYTGLTLKLAQKGEDRMNPNPLVGTIIVKDGTIISRGYHREYGGPHAERGVLASLARTVWGTTLYVTLGPCCYCGKTPPCMDAVMEGGTSHVIIGTVDPNLLVVGKGILLLNDHGIQVIQGVLEAECISQNQISFHFVHTKQPYVVTKYVMTTGGRTTIRMGQSGWITGDETRMRVHRDEDRYSTIMASVEAIFKDDPFPACRLPDGRSPVQIICGTRLRAPAAFRIVSITRSIKTVLATYRTGEDIIRPYEEAGCEVLTLPQADGHMDLAALMKRLGEMNINSILLKEGAVFSWSAPNQGLVHEVQVYVAPKLFGGKGAPFPIDGKDVGASGQAFFLK